MKLSELKQIIREEVQKLTEALKPIDKKVVQAFYDKKSLEGKLLNTDGKTLDKLGMGSDTVAVWKGHKIEITSQSAVRSDDMILRYLKKFVPRGNFDDKSYKKYFNEVKLSESKAVDKVLYMADHGYGKLAGKTVDGMSANLFKAVYEKSNDKTKEKIQTMNEKQLYIFMTKLWSKFGKQVRI